MSCMSLHELKVLFCTVENEVDTPVVETSPCILENKVVLKGDAPCFLAPILLRFSFCCPCAFPCSFRLLSARVVVMDFSDADSDSTRAPSPFPLPPKELWPSRDEIAANCALCRAEVGRGRRCGGCLGVRYCNRDCQRLHWPRHRSPCRRARSSLQTERATAPWRG